jgi:superfamily II helicase
MSNKKKQKTIDQGQYGIDYLLDGGESSSDSYPDEETEAISDCADELLRIAKREQQEETNQLEKLGRIITASSDVEKYSKMLPELCRAKTDEEIDTIFAKYGFAKEMYPAAAKLAKVVNN